MNILIGTIGSIRCYLIVEQTGAESVRVDRPDGTFSREAQPTYRVLGSTVQGVRQIPTKPGRDKPVLTPDDAGGVIGLSVNTETLTMRTKDEVTRSGVFTTPIEPGAALAVGLSWSRNRGAK